MTWILAAVPAALERDGDRLRDAVQREVAGDVGRQRHTLLGAAGSRNGAVDVNVAVGNLSVSRPRLLQGVVPEVAGRTSAS